jgi:hypothetical protein
MAIFKGFNFWRSVAMILVGMVLGIMVYHTFMDDGTGNTIHIGKYKIKGGTTTIKGDDNRPEQDNRGFLDILFSDDDEKDKK